MTHDELLRKLKWLKRLGYFEFGDKYWIQFNWATDGWRLGIQYRSDGYTRSIEFVLIKPSIGFGYMNKSTREALK